MFTKRLPILFVLCAPLLAATGCGDDADNDSSVTAGTEPTTGTSMTTADPPTTTGASATTDPSTTATTASTTDTPTSGTTEPTTGDASTGDTTGSEGNLDPEDLPDVAPCPDQDVLTDATMLDALKTAMSEGALTYLDVPFDDNDPDIFPKKCGFEEYWDPSENVDEIPWSASVDPTTLVLAGNSGICGTSDSPFADPAFPSAGTYRKEMLVAHMGSTYHVRWRVEVSGPAAGSTYSSNSIEVNSSGLEDDVTYTVDGEESNHDDLFADIVDALSTTGSLPTVTIDVESTEGDELFSADVTVLCASVE